MFAIACLLISISLLSLHLCCCFYCTFKYCLHFIHHCITFIALIYRSLLISIRRQLSTSTHNLEKFQRRSSRAFHEDSASILVFSDRFASIIISYFYSAFDQHYTYSPPSGCIFKKKERKHVTSRCQFQWWRIGPNISACLLYTSPSPRDS